MSHSSDHIRVLHADDDTAFTGMVGTVLERNDARLEVDAVTSVEEGLNYLAEHEVDCILSDYDMPDQNGIEFLRAVRNAHSDLPFVLYTGNGSEELAREAISAGVTDYCQKSSGDGQYAVVANRIVNAVERARATENAARTERRVRELTARSTDALWMFTHDWSEVIFANGRVEELFGISPEELEEHPKALFDAVHPDDRERIEAVIERISEGQSAELEVRTTGSRDDRWVWIQADPIVGDTGCVDRIVGIARDVTERRERERTVATTRQLQAVVDTVDAAIYIKDGEGRYRLMNRECRKLFGLGDRDVVGLTDDELPSDDAARRLRAHDDRVVAQGEPVRFEEEIPTDDGTRRYLTVLSPLSGANDDQEEICGVSVDISDRRRHARQLAALTDAATELMAAATNEEVATVAVEAAAEILGLEASTVYLYDGDSDAIEPVASAPAAMDLAGGPPTYTRGDDSITWRTFEEGVASAIDDVRDDPNVYNPETPIRSQLSVPLDEHGALIAGSNTPGTFDDRDVGAGMVLSRAVVAALEQVERERELTRQNERLERLTKVVSHDLRNPLTVASGRVELARTECGSEHLDAIEHALDRMSELIDDLLTLSRSSEPIVDVAPVSLASLVTDCWEAVATRNARYVVEQDLQIYADEGRLKYLLENLFQNAVRHGSDEITVRVGTLDGGTGFYVADDGSGIPVAERERIFEFGYTSETNGTGFGLAIVEQVADAHGWTVSVTSSEAGGARFEFTDVDRAG